MTHVAPPHGPRLPSLPKALSPYLLWAILALPALGLAAQLIGSSDPNIVHKLLHPTGEFSARFLIIAMLASPLVLLFRSAALPRWLKRNRRYFGVASFGYGALHTGLYLADAGGMGPVIAALPEVSIWSGWVAFAIFLPLAATSFDGAVRALGPAWKALQRWTYLAAGLTLLHWASLHDWRSPWAALIHFAPLVVLEGYRIWYWTGRRKSRRAA